MSTSPISSNVMERDHFSGKEIASWIFEQFEYYCKLQRQLKIRETPLYEVSGIIFDTTSENTGKYNGVAKCLEELRQSLYFSRFKKNCAPLVIKSCCDHVAHCILKAWIRMKPTNFVAPPYQDMTF